MLQFFDLCGDDHGAGAGDEDDCTDGDHGVDEIVIKTSSRVVKVLGVIILTTVLNQLSP